jgi:hypothetical protein
MVTTKVKTHPYILNPTFWIIQGIEKIVWCIWMSKTHPQNHKNCELKPSFLNFMHLVHYISISLSRIHAFGHWILKQIPDLTIKLFIITKNKKNPSRTPLNGYRHTQPGLKVKSSFQMICKLVHTYSSWNLNPIGVLKS